MNLFARLAAALGVVLMPAVSSAHPVTDCPLRDAPFSAALPMIDILSNPAARVVLDRNAPDLFANLPAMMRSTTPPSFAAIVDLRALMEMKASFAGQSSSANAALTDALIAKIDSDLRKIPVTDADRRDRCRRYDNDRPALTVPKAPIRLLLFEKINGFRDSPSINAAHDTFVSLANSNHWAIAVTDKGGAIADRTLRHFDVVIWNNVSGDVLTLAQRAALRRFVEHGGGFVAVHGSDGDPVTWWDWFTDTLIGARFAGHPYPNQFQTGRVVIENPADPIAKGLPGDWTVSEEWYSFKANPRASGSHIIATLDESRYDPSFFGKSLRMGDHPIVWSRCVGQGRMAYSAIGHRPELYSDPFYRRLLINAIAWAAGHERAPGAGSAVCQADH